MQQGPLRGFGGLVNAPRHSPGERVRGGEHQRAHHDDQRRQDDAKEQTAAILLRIARNVFHENLTRREAGRSGNTGAYVARNPCRAFPHSVHRRRPASRFNETDDAMETVALPGRSRRATSGLMVMSMGMIVAVVMAMIVMVATVIVMIVAIRMVAARPDA